MKIITIIERGKKNAYLNHDLWCITQAKRGGDKNQNVDYALGCYSDVVGLFGPSNGIGVDWARAKLSADLVIADVVQHCVCEVTSPK